MTGKDFLSIKDFSPPEIWYLLTLARQIKTHPTMYCDALKRKTLALIFEKSNLRCRHPAARWILRISFASRNQSRETRVRL